MKGDCYILLDRVIVDHYRKLVDFAVDGRLNEGLNFYMSGINLGPLREAIILALVRGGM
jgi:hypothetical protein